MSAERSLQSVVLKDEDGNVVAIVLDGSVYRVQTQGKVLNSSGTQIDPSTEGTLAAVDAKLATIDSVLDSIKDTDGIQDLKKWLGSTAPTVGQKAMSSSLPVAIADDQTALKVTPAIAAFHTVKVSSGNTPASITGNTASTFSVGGQTLTIDIDGTTETCTFSNPAATAGTSISGAAPSTDLGGDHKMDISIDGGASTEIDIGKDQVGGTVIAGLIEDEIQANVPNGASATCDFGVTQAGRYTITSGTTGSSSSVVVTGGGKEDMSDALNMGVAEGGTETVGTNAGVLSLDTVVDELNAQLPGVSVSGVSGAPVITTDSTGATATLEVTAGGANTALGFPTTEETGATGTGGTNLGVDGSTTTKFFTVPKHSSRTFLVTRLVYSVRDGNALNNTFGGLTQLTNGLRVQVSTDDEALDQWVNFRTNAELIARARDGGAIIDAAFSGGDDLVYADFLIEPGIRLRAGTTDDQIRFTVRDNLSGLTNFEVLAEGYLL